MTTSAGRSSRSPRLRPDRRMRIHGRRGWLVTFGLVAGGLVVATTPAVPALAGGQVCAGVVIDGTGGAPLTQGASVPPGASDLDLLSAAGDSVTQNDSGLVCVINGYPVNGLQNCLKAHHGLYYFWSYWEGDPVTNTWTYAAVGPAEHTVTVGQPYVEGWRYQDPGPASPAAAKPSVTPTDAFAQACLSVPPTTTTTTAGGSGTTGSSTTTTIPAASTHAHGHASAAAVAGSGLGTRTHGAGSQGAAVATTTTQARDGQSPSSAAGEESTSAPSTSAGGTDQKPTPSSELALADPARHRDPGGNPTLPIVIVVLVIAMLGVTAWLRWRRRPTEG